MKEILEVAVDMDATRRRDRKDAPYHTLLELVLDLERRAWNCVLHAADAKLLDNVPGLAELIAFDAGTGPRPPFVPEHPWSWEGGGLHPFRILCGQGLAFYEYGPIEPHTANHPAMENGEQMEPLKRGPPVASKILLPALFPRDHAASSAHGISMLRHARETNCVGDALANERIEYLRSRCRIGAYACRNLVEIVRSNSAHLDGVLGSAVLDEQLHAEGLTRTPSGAITAAPGLYRDEIQPAQASLRHVEETLRVSLEACDTQWFGQPDYDDRRSKLVEASWNRYRFVWGRAIALSRRVPDAPTMPPERIPRAGYGNAADLVGAIIELRDWLADLERHAKALRNSAPSVAPSSEPVGPKAEAPEPKKVPRWKKNEATKTAVDYLLQNLHHRPSIMDIARGTGIRKQTIYAMTRVRSILDEFLLGRSSEEHARECLSLARDPKAACDALIEKQQRASGGRAQQRARKRARLEAASTEPCNACGEPGRAVAQLSNVVYCRSCAAEDLAELAAHQRLDE